MTFLTLYVYTFISVEIKANNETVALRMLQNVQTMLVPQPPPPDFFNFVVGEGVIAGRGRPDCFELTILDFMSCLLPTL